MTVFWIFIGLYAALGLVLLAMAYVRIKELEAERDQLIVERDAAKRCHGDVV